MDQTYGHFSKDGQEYHLLRHANSQHYECQDAEFTDWQCIYGLTYVTIGSVRHHIEHETTSFVPSDDPVEIWRGRRRNRASRPRRLSLFSHLQWRLSSYPKAWTDPQVCTSRHGKAPQGNLVPAFADGKAHRVHVAVPTGR